MPSGATHDRVTLWSLPVVTGITLALTESSELTLLVAGGFLFGGLMFSPDLDLRSRPYKRWGWLRWIWIPYQKTLRHRSFFSHGPIVGTTLRVIYFASWLGVAGILSLAVAQLFSELSWSWSQWVQQVRRSAYSTLPRTLFVYRWDCLAVFIGLELGAVSHYISDAIGSTIKRYQRSGKKRLPPSAKSKRRKGKANLRKKSDRRRRK